MEEQRSLPVVKRKHSLDVRNIARVSTFFIVICGANLLLLTVCSVAVETIMPTLVLYSILTTIIALLWSFTIKWAKAEFFKAVKSEWLQFLAAFSLALGVCLAISTTGPTVVFAVQSPGSPAIALFFALETLAPILVLMALFGGKVLTEQMSLVYYEDASPGIPETVNAKELKISSEQGEQS